MRVLGLDFETTGLDTANDRIIEMGAVLWEVESKRPLVTVDVFLNDDGIQKKMTPEVVEMMNRICGITPEMLTEFGTDAKANLEWLEGYCAKHKVDYVVAHNGENYDKPLLMAELTRLGIEAPFLRSVPWVDTRTDIPFASEPDSRKLKHLALDIGVINHFPHRALTDVLTMLLVMSHYEFKDILEYQKIPFVVMRALVNYDNRELAKAQRYSWEKIGDQSFPKMWVKKVKENLMEQEIEVCKKNGFQVARIK